MYIYSHIYSHIPVYEWLHTRGKIFIFYFLNLFVIIYSYGNDSGYKDYNVQGLKPTRETNNPNNKYPKSQVSFQLLKRTINTNTKQSSFTLPSQTSEGAVSF